MFRPGRLLMFALIGLAVYAGFFAVPPGERWVGAFTPEEVAADELAVWKGVHAHEEFGLYFSLVVMLRDMNRYTWFRAAQAGFYMARATTTFPELQGRYERVLPDLEDAATIEKEWMAASFDPAAVARAQLDWWVTRRLPNLNSIDHVGQLIDAEYALRYHLSPGMAADAALRRAEAAQLFDSGGADPNWAGISKILIESYRSLHATLERTRRTR